MHIAQVIQDATLSLSKAGISSARLDILILLEDLLQTDRGLLLAHPERELTQAQLDTLNNFITQRKRHVPLAYIRGKAPFFGREFNVNKHVLVPRPETESIIELLLTLDFRKPPVIADVGTGSGCIGVTAALELPGSTVHLYDADKEALAVARSNARQYGVKAGYFVSNVLDTWHDDYDIVLANLPYVPNEYPINEAAGFEPKLALFSGSDGLDHYRHMWQQIAQHQQKPAHVIIEALPEQHTTLAKLAESAAYKLHAAQGYVQHFVQAIAYS